MSTLNSLNRNMMRLTGLNSGMDTEGMVAQMMQRSQIKADRQFRSHSLLEWKQEKYQEVNNLLRKLKDDFGTVLKQDQNMLSELNYRSLSVASTDPGFGVFFSVNAKPYAEAGAVDLDYVKQLATAASAETAGTVTRGGGGLILAHSLASIDAQLPGGLALSRGEDGQRLLKFSLGGQDFSFDAGMSLDSVISSFNAKSTNLQMSYSQLTDKFTISTKAMGDGVTIGKELRGLDATTEAFLGSMGIDLENGASVKRGQNAIFSINGIEKTTKSNMFEIGGLEFTLKRAFGMKPVSDGAGNIVEVPNPDQRVTFTVSRDIQKSVDTVKKYVDAYNEMIGALNDILTEDPPRNYNTGESWQPLTDAEKEEMEESEIERWESKAKSGIMRNDPQLQRLISELRMSFYDKAAGMDKAMFEIGIKTSTSGPYADTLIGKLEVDEIALREALTTNPDEVFKMFTAKPEQENKGGTVGMGLVTRINTLIDNYVDYNERETQYYNQQDIDRAMNRYNEMLDKMADEEDRLWAKISNMERVMGELNSQSSWFAQQMGG